MSTKFLCCNLEIIKTPAANNNVTMSPSNKEGRRDDKNLHAQSLDLLVELDL